MQLPAPGSNERRSFVYFGAAVVLAIGLTLAALGLVVVNATLSDHRTVLNELGDQVHNQQTQINRDHDVIDHLRATVAKLGGDPYMPGPKPTN